MIALPSVDQVVDALLKLGATRVRLTQPLYGPRGPVMIVALRRVDDDGKVYLSAPLPEYERMSWKEVDSLCRQLGLDPAAVDVGMRRPPIWWEHPELLGGGAAN